MVMGFKKHREKDRKKRAKEIKKLEKLVKKGKISREEFRRRVHRLGYVTQQEALMEFRKALAEDIDRLEKLTFDSKPESESSEEAPDDNYESHESDENYEGHDTDSEVDYYRASRDNDGSDDRDYDSGFYDGEGHVRGIWGGMEEPAQDVLDAVDNIGAVDAVEDGVDVEDEEDVETEELELEDNEDYELVSEDEVGWIDDDNEVDDEVDDVEFVYGQEDYDDPGDDSVDEAEAYDFIYGDEGAGSSRSSVSKSARLENDKNVKKEKKRTDVDETKVEVWLEDD